MCALIDELENPQTREVLLRLKLRFGQGVSLDLRNLIVSGHSFGGMTAVETAMLEPERVKACLTMDPWLYCRH